MPGGNAAEGHGNVTPGDAVDGKAMQRFEMANEVKPDGGPGASGVWFLVRLPGMVSMARSISISPH
jgi:hypothetical protein